MKLSNFFTNSGLWIGAATFLSILSGCNNGFVYEDLAECVPDRRIRLSFTYNMDFDEKREEQVKHAKVFAFDGQGVLADFNVAEHSNLLENDYSIDMGGLEKDVPYKFITWCGTDQEAVNINVDPTETMARGRAEGDDQTVGGEGDPDLSLMAGLGATVASDDNGIIKTELEPVHYGQEDFTFSQMTGVEEYTISLTKDTNVIHVQLGKVLDPDKYEVYIEDKNDELDFNNEIANEDVHVKYYPVESLTQKNVDIYVPAGQGEYSESTIKGSVLTFHTSRLFDPNDVHNPQNLARLVIIDKEKGKTLLNQPLGEFLLESKPLATTLAPDGEYWRTKADQEYLDREDEYTAYFLIEDYLSMVVYINGWRVVLQPVYFE